MANERTPKAIMLDALREIAGLGLRVDLVRVGWITVTQMGRPKSLIPDIEIECLATDNFEIPSEGWR